MSLAGAQTKEDVMVRFLLRSLYRCIIRMHPPYFRAQFARDMLWIFDEEVNRQGAARLLADGSLSLARQWMVRRAWKPVIDRLISDSPCPYARYTSVPLWRPWRDF